LEENPAIPEPYINKVIPKGCQFGAE